VREKELKMSRCKLKQWISAAVVLFFAVFTFLAVFPGYRAVTKVIAQAKPSSSPTFDQAAALAKLREQIKGRENEPAAAVFKNIGVDCTHCHVPEKWEADEKPEKQISRDMSAMVFRINGELLKGIKNLKGPNPIINCTTCHRGSTKPALDLPRMKS
jgi:Photosynthetic reaction centre cytochrome C subunit